MHKGKLSKSLDKFLKANTGFTVSTFKRFKRLLKQEERAKRRANHK